MILLRVTTTRSMVFMIFSMSSRARLTFCQKRVTKTPASTAPATHPITGMLASMMMRSRVSEMRLMHRAMPSAAALPTSIRLSTSWEMSSADSE